MSGTLLVIDDDRAILQLVERMFRALGWDVRGFEDANEALRWRDPEGVDVILQDLELPGMSGLELLTTLRRTFPDASVLILTGHGGVRRAVEAIQAGADNFLQKPADMDYLRAMVERARERTVLQREQRRLARAPASPRALEHLERFPSMRPLVREAKALAESDAVVLLQGETGTGKGWLARLLHATSLRAQRPFLEVNCAALSPGILESELFGHEAGAFTDARYRKRGLFEAADKGTLFLDEVGEMAPSVQPRLLTALESRAFRRVGGTEEISVDVRIITATNRDLARDVQKGRFRKDLFYRLSAFPLELPPLRDRDREELLTLAHQLLAELAAELHRETPRLSLPVEDMLAAHSWPGNVRELRNALERALLLSDGAEELLPAHLPRNLDRRAVPRSTAPNGYPVEMSLEDVERSHTLRVLRHFDGNRSRSARALGIGRRTLYDRLERYGID